MTVGIEQTIEQVERLYQAVTGKQPPAPNGPHAPIPPEVDPAQHVEEQLSRLLGLMTQKDVTQVAQATWTPPLLAWEDDQEIRIEIDLPGVPREQLEVITTENLITVRGQRPAPWGQGKRPRGPSVAERPLGPFHRVVPLPAQRVNLEQLTAQLRDGVLEIRVPWSPQAVQTERQVQIR